MSKRITVASERTQTALMLAYLLKTNKPLARSLGALLRLVPVK